MGVNVVLVDDHTVVRDGIKAILEREGSNINVVGEAANGKEALEISVSEKIDIYVLDISMPEMNGIDTAEALMKRDPSTKIIILSMYDNRNFVDKVLKTGVKGYLLKENASDEVVRAIHEVAEGKFYLSPKISNIVVSGYVSQGAPEKVKKEKSLLTKREKQILQFIAEGLSAREIAEKLKLSVNTVHVHRRSIMRKLNIHKQTNLVRYALKEGIAHL